MSRSCCEDAAGGRPAVAKRAGELASYPSETDRRCRGVARLILSQSYKPKRAAGSAAQLSGSMQTSLSPKWPAYTRFLVSQAQQFLSQARLLFFARLSSRTKPFFFFSFSSSIPLPSASSLFLSPLLLASTHHRTACKRAAANQPVPVWYKTHLSGGSLRQNEPSRAKLAPKCETAKLCPNEIIRSPTTTKKSYGGCRAIAWKSQMKAAKKLANLSKSKLPDCEMAHYFDSRWWPSMSARVSVGYRLAGKRACQAKQVNYHN